MDSIPILLRMTLALGVVLGLIFGAVWLIRKVGPVRFLTGKNQALPMDVVGQTHLAPRRSIYAVKAAGRLLLLGVTPTSISLLTEIPDEDRSPPESGAFGRELADVLGGLERSRARLKGEDA